MSILGAASFSIIAYILLYMSAYQIHNGNPTFGYILFGIGFMCFFIDITKRMALNEYNERRIAKQKVEYDDEVYILNRKIDELESKLESYKKSIQASRASGITSESEALKKENEVLNTTINDKINDLTERLQHFENTKTTINKALSQLIEEVIPPAKEDESNV